jgi:N-acetylglucosamine-6-phosphate deacetylase
MQQLKIYNGRLVTPSGMINSGCILITGGTITRVSKNDIEAPNAVAIDAGGNYISPGFIDIHVHGGGGHDFMDGTQQAFLEVAKLHARYGTTALTPTTLSCSHDELLNILDVYDKANAVNIDGAAFIGLHLEGPYFAMGQRGAQDPRFIRNPNVDEYKEVLQRSASVKRWSAAPELPGALEFGEYLCRNSVLPSFAHTEAVYEDIVAAFAKGYTHATHLYSGMLGVTRRDARRYAGAVEASFIIDDITVEIIADGIHLPPALLKLVYQIKGADKTALITDAMRGAGMPPGKSILGSNHNGLDVIVEDDVAKLPDRSAFAGSVATADRLVRNMVQLAGVPLLEAVQMITATPAAIMGIANKKGRLVEGMDADIILFDEDINVQTTIVEGRVVYDKVRDENNATK